MAANSPDKEPSSTSDDDGDSGEDDMTADRRRRLCIERTHQIDEEPKTKRLKVERNNHRTNYRRARQRATDCMRPQTSYRRPVQQVQQSHRKDHIIHINPKFIKKFIEKSMTMTSANSSEAGPWPSTTRAKPENPGMPSSASTASSAQARATNMIENIDFKTSPHEALLAASTMAVIRLVTECIENDKKRDEKMNKVLVSRLIAGLT